MKKANLSSDYFTNRQDRYVKLSEQDELSEYLSELIELTSSISYRLEADELAEDGRPDGLRIVWPETNASRPPIDSRRASREFKKIAHQMYSGFTDRWRQKLLLIAQSTEQADHTQPHVSIFPTLQMSPFKIRHETALMIPKLIDFVDQLSSTPEHHSLVHEKTVLNWTSGYFSLLREYKSQMLSSNAHVEIITASPQANGFYQSNGVSKYIPSAYSYLENLFRNEVRKSAKQNQIIIRQWNRAGWTYHAKGLWINRSVRNVSREGEEERCLVTSIGSSNFGRRSAERDLECNLFIMLDRDLPRAIPGQPEDDKSKPEDGSLSSQLVDELSLLKGHVQPNDQKEAHVGIFVKFFTRLIRNML
ncbi:hypothetical protein PtB15_4B181 [Puccinia triticina]|nr:hypothetical protein PtB15_4B181 [Puccinia triticina]